MHVRAFVVATGMVAVAALPFAARERAADDGINAKIRQEGMSHSQIADRLQQPLGTIKTWVRTALIKIRQEIAEAAAS